MEVHLDRPNLGDGPEVKFTAFEKVVTTACAIGAVGFALWMKLSKGKEGPKL